MLLRWCSILGNNVALGGGLADSFRRGYHRGVAVYSDEVYEDTWRQGCHLPDGGRTEQLRRVQAAVGARKNAWPRKRKATP